MPATEDKKMIDRSRYDYTPTVFKDPKTGKTRRSLGNGDAVARAMLGLDQAALLKVLKANNVDSKIADKADSVNAGQFRMMVGNALRGLVRKLKDDEVVVIGSHEIRSLDQDIDVDAPEPKEAPTAEKAEAAPKAEKAKGSVKRKRAA